MFDIQKIKEFEELLKKESLTSYMEEIGAEYQSGRFFCPFHDETNPSLSVDEGEGIWHCFSCGRGGGYGKLVSEYIMSNDPDVKIYYQALEQYLQTHRELSDKLGFTSMKDSNYNKILQDKDSIMEYVYSIKAQQKIVEQPVTLINTKELTPEEIVDQMYKLQYEL